MTIKERLKDFFAKEDFIVEGKILDHLVEFVYEERKHAYQAGYDDARFFVEDEVV